MLGAASGSAAMTRYLRPPRNVRPSHGNFDLAAYDAYLAGTLEDPEFSQDDMDAAMAALPAGAPALA
jgi:hypothetical protein